MDRDRDGNTRIVRIDYQLVLGTSFDATVPADVTDTQLPEFLEAHYDDWCDQVSDINDLMNMDDGRVDIRALRSGEEPEDDPVPIGIEGMPWREGGR